MTRGERTGADRLRLLRSSVRALAEFWRSRELRPLGVARGAGSTAEWMWFTAATVFAYELGGVSAVGLIAVAAVLPAAVVAPTLSAVIDRYPRHQILLGAVVLRAVTISLAVVSYFTFTNVWLLAVFTALEGLATLTIRPTSTALLPFVTRRPSELVSAQATLGAVESVGLLLGSALGGLLLGLTSPGVAFAVAAAIAWSAVVALTRLHVEVTEDVGSRTVGVVAIVRESLKGFPALVRGQAWVITVFTCSVLLLAGAVDVLVVAVAFELLSLPESGPGVLTACIGAGGILGAAVMSGVDARRVGPWLIGAVVLMGGSLAVIAGVSITVVVAVLLAIAGAGLVVSTVGGQSQLQRLVDEAELGRALGVMESLGFLATALGAALTPVLIDRWGVETTLITTGVAGIVLALGLVWPLLAIDRQVTADLVPIEALDGIAFLDPLPNVMRARIAGRVDQQDVPAGTRVTVQGEDADSFFIVDHGALDVAVDEQPVGSLGPGDFFGEVALLADCPRTATVTARETTRLRVLHRTDFLMIVTGHAGVRHLVSTAAEDRSGRSTT